MFEIKQYCKENNILKSDLAKELNVSLSYLSKIDYRQITPSERVLNELLKRNIIIDLESNEQRKGKAQEIIKKQQETIKELRLINLKLTNKLNRILENKFSNIERELNELNEIKRRINLIIENTEKTLKE